MAINFPTNPSINDLYGYGNNVWQYNGSCWKPFKNELIFMPEQILYTRVELGTGNQDIGTTYTVVSWVNEINDSLEAFDSGFPTRLTIPNGITKACLTGYVAFGVYNTYARNVKIVKNGNTTIVEKSVTIGRTESGMSVSTGIISVSTGDYFELYANSNASGMDLIGSATWGGPCWFEIYKVNG